MAPPPIGDEQVSSTASTTTRPAPASAEPSRRAPAPRRKPMDRASVRWSIRIVSILLTLLAWELYGRQVNPIFLSYPTQIARTVPSMISSGELPHALVTSLSELGLGLGIALILGIAVGFLIGLSRVAEAILDTQINALYSTPVVALIPILVLWLGLGYHTKVVVIVLEAFFPIVVNTFAGVRNMSGTYLDISKAENANLWQTFTKFVFPATLPYLMTGIRLGVGRSITGMVVAEELTSIAGLGGLIVKNSNSFHTPAVFVTVVTLVILGVLLTQIARFLERRVASWK
jgi:NitT/TauT family transport system permease protein